jgi:hypothetical protein
LVHDGLTPFREVKVLAAASVHSFRPAGLISKPYWTFDITESNARANRAELAVEMTDLIRRSISDRLQARSGQVFVSLSGGIDSRSVAGFLRGLVPDPNRIVGITYHNGPRVGDNDADAAEVVARRLGIGHVVISGYDGNLVALLQRNSDLGQGIARFNEEGNAWSTVAPLLWKDGDGVLFVGDLFPHDVRRRAMRTVPEVLNGVAEMQRSSAIAWFLNRFDSKSSAAIATEWDAHFEAAVARIPADDNPLDIRARVYVEHWLGRQATMWREYMLMPDIRVANPYLDRNLLDFVGALPRHLRHKEGGVYMEAVDGALPGLADIPTAHGGWNAPDWGRELRNAAPELKATLRESSSLLDELVPPEVIASLLDSGLGAVTRGRDNVLGASRQFVKRAPTLRRVARAVKLRTRPLEKKHVSWQRLAIDLLVLRGFLDPRRFMATHSASRR